MSNESFLKSKNAKGVSMSIFWYLICTQKNADTLVSALTSW